MNLDHNNTTISPEIQIEELQKINIQKKFWSDTEIDETIFPDVDFLAKDLIATGLTAIVGSPKIGKSWLVLNLACGFSAGDKVLGNIPVTQNYVLYLALEDTPRRLQNRRRKIGAKKTGKLFFFTKWTCGNEGIESLKKYLDKFPETKIIIIDTWVKFSPIADSNDYNKISSALTPLKNIADEREISIIIVHHTRKQVSNDFIDSVLGSQGFAGACDTILVLTRNRNQFDAILSVTGRDIVEKQYSIKFDTDFCSWVIEGDVSGIQKTKERQQIYDLLKSYNVPMTPKEVYKVFSERGDTRSESTIKNMLWKMKNDGELISNSGAYSIVQSHVDTE